MRLESQVLLLKRYQSSLKAALKIKQKPLIKHDAKLHNGEWALPHMEEATQMMSAQPKRLKKVGGVLIPE